MAETKAGGSEGRIAARRTSAVAAVAVAAATIVLTACAIQGCGRRSGNEPATLTPFVGNSERLRAGGTLVCPGTDQKITVDGRLDEAAWLKAAAFELDVFPWRRDGAAAGQKTIVRALWDRECIYFGFDCEDSDILSRVTEADAALDGDDRVCVYLCPDPETEEYYCFEVSAMGTVRDYRAKIYREFDAKWDAGGAAAAARIRGTRERSDDRDGGYSVEIAVPWRCMSRGGARMAADEATVVLVCVCRADASGAAGGRAETFSAVKSPGTRAPDFHLMGAFWRMVLGGRPD
ncbi:MAG: carbohydrate-binding family 9-like protein [Planctomycetota bacterium]|nr:carbohydrate-binding family 9-like protein [Planctomycetota bacterium]